MVTKNRDAFCLGYRRHAPYRGVQSWQDGHCPDHHPHSPQVDFISFAVMIITVMVNITVMIYEYRRGKQMQSDILIVDSMHTRADIFISLSVIVALICVKLGFPIIDPVITLIISGFYRLFRFHHHTAGVGDTM